MLIQQLSGKCLLVLTANSIEHEAFSKKLLHTQKISVEALPHISIRVGKLNAFTIVHAAVEAGYSTQSGRGLGAVAPILLEIFDPKLVILAGFCWGAPSKVDVLDVIVSNDVTGINKKRFLTSSNMLYKPISLISNFALPDEDDHFYKLVFTHESINVFVGNILSGEDYYKGDSIRDNLLEIFPLTFGGDMEAYFMAVSCEQKKIPWLVVKGVSDWAGDDTDNHNQRKAAENSAEIVENILPLLIQFNNISIPYCPLTHLSYPLNPDVYSLMNAEQYSIEEAIHEYVDLHKYDDKVARRVARLLCEIALNAYEHGRGKLIKIDFKATAIEYQDDGREFSINSLSNYVASPSNGGSTAYSDFNKYYVSTEPSIKVTESRVNERNIIRFEFVEAQELVNVVRQECSLSVNFGYLGRALPSSDALNFDASCKKVYIDVSGPVSYSCIYYLMSSAADLPNTVDTIFIHCTDSDVRSYIERCVSDPRFTYL